MSGPGIADGVEPLPADRGAVRGQLGPTSARNPDRQTRSLAHKRPVDDAPWTSRSIASSRSRVRQTAQHHDSGPGRCRCSIISRANDAASYARAATLLAGDPGTRKVFVEHEEGRHGPGPNGRSDRILASGVSSRCQANTDEAVVPFHAPERRIIRVGQQIVVAGADHRATVTQPARVCRRRRKPRRRTGHDEPVVRRLRRSPPAIFRSRYRLADRLTATGFPS